MKKALFMVIIMLSTVFMSGCFKRDDMDNITIITTTYPVTYLATKMYGNNSSIESIYPSGVDMNEYELTDKQINEYAKADLFIYCGLNQNEKKLATKLLNANKNIKLIDATQGLKITSTYEELWLSPSNFLMMAQNIKEHLEDYIKSTVIKTELNKNYENIKLTISKFDAQFKIIAENATYKNIITVNQSLKFLSKYGFEVICIDENEDRYKSNLLTAKEAINKKETSVIFAINGNVTETVQKLNQTIITIKSINILSEEDAKDQLTYDMVMDSFLEDLRTEVYS
ncbi:MAG: metal ABC transporter substrate-binding protein [Bacilli bacterium]|nr:metal ABC transporter substrate-binding protein [Bacilli bacterium]